VATKGRKYLQKYNNQLAVYCSVVSLLHSKSLIESIKKATITSLLLLLHRFRTREKKSMKSDDRLAACCSLKVVALATAVL